MTHTTDDAGACGPECADMHTCAGRCVLAPLYPSLELDALRAAFDEVREWRRAQLQTHTTRYFELDAILDRVALGQIKRRLDQDDAPTSLPDAVEAHHRLIRARRTALADTEHTWNLAEAEAIRQITRFMPKGAHA